MTLRKVGETYYGESQADIYEALKHYSEDGYPATKFGDSICECGGITFRLLLDDAEGAALRICNSCMAKHPIGDSDEYLEDAELEECQCPCGSNIFEISIGLALYRESNDIRWLYVGCRCPKCNLTACYGDWKNEYLNYRELLRKI